MTGTPASEARMVCSGEEVSTTNFSTLIFVHSQCTVRTDLNFGMLNGSLILFIHKYLKSFIFIFVGMNIHIHT